MNPDSRIRYDLLDPRSFFVREIRVQGSA